MGKRIEEFKKICQKYNIALAYLFGSQKENGQKVLEDQDVCIGDSLADIDVGVVFLKNIEEITEKHELYADIYNDLEDVSKPYPWIWYSSRNATPSSRLKPSREYAYTAYQRNSGKSMR